MRGTISTVIFVPNTRGGILVRKLREREPTLSEMTGFGIKYEDAGGTHMMNSFNLD